jgi:hypothetical protein
MVRSSGPKDDGNDERMEARTVLGFCRRTCSAR